MTFRITIALAASALSLAATAVAAAPADHMTDAQYVAAARCQGLASARRLGPVDTHAFDALMRRQESGRSHIANQFADAAREDAARQASTAGAYSRSQLEAERDGTCQAMLSTTNLAKAN